MSRSMGFRVLALTATPGTKADAVQQVLTNCYISKVEVRTEQDEDVKTYLPNKETRLEIVKMSKELENICGMLRAVIAPIITRLIYKKAIQHYQGEYNPFILKCAQIKFTSSVPAHLSKQERQQILGDFCAAYFLKCQLWDIERNSVAVPLKKLQDCSRAFGTLASIRQRPDFKNVVAALQNYAHERRGLHPKLVALENIMIRHFDEHNGSNAGSSERGGGTRVMVFASGRDWVEEIVSRLTSTGNSVVKAAAFIGQAAGKTDPKTGVKTKGQTQKEQQAVLEAFRQGTVNTLICTCIGEEGLDVGEVDLIVHYDTVNSAIRNIQRSGRTGRRRAGCVVQLLMEGQEESEHLQNSKKQSEMEKTLKRLAQGRKLSMYANDKNFLPRVPKMLDVEFDIPQIVLSSANKTAQRSRKRRLHGLSTQEHQWLETNGYGERRREDGENKGSEGQREEEEEELSLHRHPESQVVPTSTHRIDHNLLSQHFVAIMLRLNSSRSGTYETEREAYSKWQGPGLSLTQGSGNAQSSVSGQLSQSSQCQVSANHRLGGGARPGSQRAGRRRPVIIDEEEESDDVEARVAENLLDEDTAAEIGDGTDGLEDLELEDVDAILAECSRVHVDDQVDDMTGGQLETCASREAECGHVESDDDLFSAYNGKSMFGEPGGSNRSIDGAAVSAYVEKGSRSKEVAGSTGLSAQGDSKNERMEGCGKHDCAFKEKMKADAEQGTGVDDGGADTGWDDLEIIEETLPAEDEQTFMEERHRATDGREGKERTEGPIEQQRSNESAMTLGREGKNGWDATCAREVEIETRTEIEKELKGEIDQERETEREGNEAARNREQDLAKDCKTIRQGEKEERSENNRVVERAGAEESASVLKGREYPIPTVGAKEIIVDSMVLEEHAPERITQTSSQFDQVSKDVTTIHGSVVAVMAQDAEAAGDLNVLDLDSIFPMMNEGPGKNGEHQHSA